jgi:hypothetical protein
MRPSYFYVFFSVFIISCNDKKDQEEILINPTPNEINATLGQNTDFKDKRVAIEAYVSFPDSTSENSAGLVQMNATTEPMNHGDKLAKIYMESGTGKNQITLKMSKTERSNFITEEYEVNEDEIKMTTNDGTKYPLTQKVRISGTVFYPKNKKGDYAKRKNTIQKAGVVKKVLYEGLAFRLLDIRIDKVN